MPSYTELFLSMIALMVFNEGFMRWSARKQRHNDQEIPQKTKSKQQQKQPRKNSRGEMLVTFSVWPDWKILHLVWKAIFLFSLSSRGKCIASVNKSFQEQRTLCMGHLAVVHMSLVLWVLFEDYRTLLNHDKNVGYCLSPDFKSL